MTTPDTRTPTDLSTYRVYESRVRLAVWHHTCGLTVAHCGTTPTLYDLLTAACGHDCPEAGR